MFDYGFWQCKCLTPLVQSCIIHQRAAKNVPETQCPGARFLTAPETFRACDAIFSSSVSKNRLMNMPETSCIEENLYSY